MLNQTRFVMTVAVAATLMSVVAPVWGQARYDDEDPRERFSIRIGGYSQQDLESSASAAV